MKKTILVPIALLAAAGLWIYLAIPAKHPPTLTLYGNVDIRQVDISFRVNGTLKEMFFEEGDQVQKGSLLAELDDGDYQEMYQKSLSEVKRYEAQMKEAISVLETNLPLCKQKITSQRNCTSYTNARDEATAAYQAAITAANYQKNQLDYTKVYAPDNGIISIRIQEPGANIQAGQLVYTLTKNKPLWIRVYLPETELGNVAYGTRARILTDSIDNSTGKRREYNGHIGYISPVAEFTPKTVQTEDLRTDLVYRLNVYVDDADEFLKQGMPVTVIINTAARENADARNPQY